MSSALVSTLAEFAASLSDATSNTWIPSETTIVSILSAVLGAYFGTLGGAKYADRKAKRERIEDEIHNLSRAAITAYTVCDKCIAFKRQFLDEIVRRYEISRAAYVAELNSPTTCKRLRVDLFFYTTSPIALPDKALVDLVMRSSYTSGLMRRQAIAISECCESLSSLVAARNSFIETAKGRISQVSDSEMAQLYYAIPGPNGFIDSTYRDIVTGLKEITEDCLYHSIDLGNKLAKLALLKRESSRSILAPEADLTIPVVDFSEARKEGHFPAKEKYTSWTESTNPKLRRRWHETIGQYKKRLEQEIGSYED